jgi:hypothetical protein
MVGSLARGFHEGSRSEYLAQFVFSSFGTAIPVPHQEDTGIDLYCTLLEQGGGLVVFSDTFIAAHRASIIAAVFERDQFLGRVPGLTFQIVLCWAGDEKTPLAAFALLYASPLWLVSRERKAPPAVSASGAM